MTEWSEKLARKAQIASIPSIVIVVPTYGMRDVAPLKAIQIEAKAVNALLIIIVDDPTSTNLEDVLKLENVHTRVRVNASNRGASATRNRGIRESR